MTDTMPLSVKANAAGRGEGVPGSVLVRDTKDNSIGPVLRVTSADWGRFVSAIRADSALS
jgi:hypothetical protein